MQSKHTPGPWKIRPVFIAQKDAEALHFGEYALNLWGIAGRTTPLNTSPTLARSEAEANAKVMEAAPELLRALKLIHDWWQEAGDWSTAPLHPGALLGEGDDDSAAIGNIVAAAIDKAEGR